MAVFDEAAHSLARHAFLDHLHDLVFITLSVLHLVFRVLFVGDVAGLDMDVPVSPLCRVVLLEDSLGIDLHLGALRVEPQKQLTFFDGVFHSS